MGAAPTGGGCRLGFCSRRGDPVHRHGRGITTSGCAALLNGPSRRAGRRCQRDCAVEQRNLALKAFKQLVYDVQEKLGQTPATRSIRQSLLNTAIAGLEEIASSAAGSAPDLSQAVAHQKLGDIFRIIGRSADGTPALRPLTQPRPRPASPRFPMIFPPPKRCIRCTWDWEC